MIKHRPLAERLTPEQQELRARLQQDEIRPFTMQEVCLMLDTSRVTLTKAINDGKLNAVKVGNRWRISRDSLKAYLGQK